MKKHSNVKKMKSAFFKKLFLGLSITTAVGFSSLQFLQNLERAVLFESIESKTVRNQPVYNKVKFKTDGKKDIWSMEQNHHALKGEWDEIQIVVDKTEKPYTASYKQFQKGQEVDYTISCFQCHANGPRAIRANFDSQKVKNSLLDKLQVFAWNLKIKHYGEIVTKQNTILSGKTRKVNLKRDEEGMLDKLNIKTCNYCHGKESLMGRTQLVKQQRGTIIHLLKTKQMPPWPFRLTQDDLRELKTQLN